MPRPGNPRQRFRRISAAGIFFQGGAAAVDTGTVEVERDLRRYFGRPEEGRAPEYARYLERQRHAMYRFDAAAANLATEPQRARSLRRLQGFIDDFSALAREDG